jgi:hypothetical protein
MPTPSSAERHLDPARMITIVSGLPRSGTSMMMQMLEAAGLEIASDALRAADADNPRGYYELEAVKRIRDDDSFLGECVGRVVKIVAPLLPSLPEEYDYRIVFMERDLAEVLASQREMSCGAKQRSRSLRFPSQHPRRTAIDGRARPGILRGRRRAERPSERSAAAGSSGRGDGASGRCQASATFR